MVLLSRQSSVGTGHESARRLPAVAPGETCVRPAVTAIRLWAYAAPGVSGAASRYGFGARRPWPAAQPTAGLDLGSDGARYGKCQFRWLDQISSAHPARR